MGLFILIVGMLLIGVFSLPAQSGSGETVTQTPDVVTRSAVNVSSSSWSSSVDILSGTIWDDLEQAQEVTEEIKPDVRSQWLEWRENNSRLFSMA